MAPFNSNAKLILCSPLANLEAHDWPATCCSVFRITAKSAIASHPREERRCFRSLEHLRSSAAHTSFSERATSMPGEVKGKKAATQFLSPVEAHADIAWNSDEDQARFTGRPRRNREATTPTNPTIAAVEQWLCLLLGLVCMVCGVWGICMKYDQELPSGHIPWLGSMYGPALRGTAVASFVSGAVLVRRGLTRPRLSSVSGGRKVVQSGGENGSCNTENISARRTISGFRWRSKGRN